ncbi:TPR and ankyrin repeat-containing protein 1 [Discoglossus pictus]
MPGESNLFRLVLKIKPTLKEKISHKDGNGDTLLHIVATSPTATGYKMNQAQDVRMLLEYGCDPNITNQQGKTASDILKKNKNFKAEAIIKKHLASQNQTNFTEPADIGRTSSPVSETVPLVSAVTQLSDFCKLETTQVYKVSDFLKHKKVKSFLSSLSNVKEIPPDMTCDIPESFAEGLICQLLQQQKWQEVLLLLTGNSSGETNADRMGLISRCPLGNLDIGRVISNLNTKAEFKLPLIKLLLKQGASPNGIGAVCELPIQICLKRKDFAMAYLLLNAGGHPQSVSMKDGDTPLHAAVSIAINKKDDHGIWMMKYLLDLHSSDPSAYCYLDPNVQDKNGDTIIHLLFLSEYSKSYPKIMELLAKFDIKLTIKNNLGKDPKHKIKNTDPRMIAWNEARKKCKHIPSSLLPKSFKSSTNGDARQHRPQMKLPSQVRFPAQTPCDKPTNEFDKCISLELPCENVEDSPKPMTLREGLLQTIGDLIKCMELSKTPSETKTVEFLVNVKSSEKENEQKYPVCLTNPTKDFEDSCEDGAEMKNDAAEITDHELTEDVNNIQKSGLLGEEEEQLEEDLDLSNIDFNNMTWEIECAPEALKKLGSKAVPQYMKNKIMISIQKLGNGEWTRGLNKQLKHLNSDIKLYEVKLDKGGRMLWELAIDFSPRCSEEPEKIIATELSTQASEKTGRVYTEIIRIWDIVLDHCKLRNAIEGICSAYNRGLGCILRKKLKGISKAQTTNTEKRIPSCFVEDIELERNADLVIPDYFPPASAAETEYNIMKFHSFSTDMALNILHNINSRVEYPFRVGELEYAVIDLNPKPLETIILIGRSGTGKTTCCMYRLWKKFHSYWEKVESIGGPWLVQQTWQRRKYEARVDLNDEEEITESDESNSTNEEQVPLEQECLIVEDQSSESEDGEDKSVKLEHFHPIFITKNHVLCQEVQRNFLELSKSTKATSHFKPIDANVYKLQDIQDENFPVFVTSQQLLLLLDASMPEQFFPRNEDGSLKRSIIGWSALDEVDITDLLREDDEFDANTEIEEEEKECELKENDPRVFVTFELFANELWPKMVKGKAVYNAALVWKEIKSFLKGSFEALSCSLGRLTEEEYIKLGKKRAPNFQGDRKEIYRLFVLYEQIKSKKGYFDEEDFLYNLSCRLSKVEELPWSIHELYGDEIQDFTQAELFLLMRCINDPNAMFLTGDTAQSIMKGVSFRFSDLRSLFYYANKNCVSDQKNCIVRKPKRIYQLYQNYRSHSGILYLASGVVDLLQHYFPESFDRLPRDCGLFDGPKPTVLESCSVSDLAILLRGNKRKTQPIEFGAHQVILVANETAKENIPEELSLALVLTIYEAKGLEFDDVLLYNFFTDSEASKEWRIISSFSPAFHSHEERQPLIEVPLDSTIAPTGRPFTLNPEMHKMLNGELKQLYTAVTRARVNLWIFDENLEKRAPAFEYFIKRNFVKVVQTDENKDLDDNMFVKSSSKEEWIAQGDYYARNQCWKVAAKCYQKGGATDKEKLSFAHDEVLKLQAKKISPREKQMEYIRLAKTYLECKEAKLALKCLTFAKEFRLCAELCKKMEKIKEAAFFYKKSQDIKTAAKCFEQIGEFDLALNIYHQEKMFEEAAEIIERHKKKHPDAQFPYTAEECYLEAAADCFRNNKMKKMSEMLSKLDIEDHLFFLKKRKRWREAADLLKSKGRSEEAAILMRQHGKLLEAADLTTNRAYRATCLLAAARQSVAECNEDNLGDILTEAAKLFEETQNHIGVAEATLLQGIVNKDSKKLNDSFNKFFKMYHNAGIVESLFEWVQCEQSDDPSLLYNASRGLDYLVTLAKALKETKNNAEREMVKSCFEFFGIVQMDGNQCSVIQFEGARILKMAEEYLEIEDKKTHTMYYFELADLKMLLEKHLMKRLCDISEKILGKVYPDICPKFIAGLDCEVENCQDLHKPAQRFEIKKILDSKKNLITICGLLLEAKCIFTKDVLSELKDILNSYFFRFCSSLVNLYFPRHFHFRILSENPVTCKFFEDMRKRFPKSCKNMLNEYAKSLINQEDTKNRRESTDLWLKAMHVFILSSYPEKLQHYLDCEERQYSKELERQKKQRPEGKLAMLRSDASKGSVKDTHIHFFRLLQGAVEQLYVKKNPDECKRHFYRFMNVFISKCVDPLIPNIGNTVMLLEFQFILCCAVLMRFSQSTTIFLPKSYISILYHWEFMFGKNRTKSVIKDTFSILWDYKPKDMMKATTHFRHHIKYLARVLCGDINEQFNVLHDAFNDIDCISSGEAERAVVFCLTMIVNFNRVVNEQSCAMLWMHFPEIQEKLKNMELEFPSRVPKRLVNIVNKVAEASRTEEVIDLLQNLLIQRDDEHLVECYWRWDIGYNKGSVHGIFYDELNLKNFTPIQHFEQDLSASNIDNDLEDDQEESDDPVAALASQVKQKHSAIRQLDDLLLLVCFCIKWKRYFRLQRKKNQMEMEEPIPDTFKKADIDRTQCDLCGVKFSQKPLLFSTPPEECEEGTTLSPTLDSVEGRDTEAVQNEGETYASHLTLEKHRSQFKAYRCYLQYFKINVNEVVCEGKALVQTMQQTSGEHLTSKEEFNLVQTKIENKIKVVADTIDIVYEKKTWAEAERLLESPVNDLATTISEAHNLIKKTERNKKTKGGQKADPFEHEIDYPGFDELCNKKSKRAKRRRSKHH